MFERTEWAKYFNLRGKTQLGNTENGSINRVININFQQNCYCDEVEGTEMGGAWATHTESWEIDLKFQVFILLSKQHTYVSQFYGQSEAVSDSQ
jgi:hypothetical protein